MKLPGSEHPIVIEKDARRLRVAFAGRILAETANALTLREAAYPAVIYVPRADADMKWFERTSHHTHCPYKGEASYFTLVADSRRAENAVWSYEDPFPAVARIKDHLAFYPQHVEIEETP